MRIFSHPDCQAQTPGVECPVCHWQKIGVTCSAGRRSMWLKVNRIDEDSGIDSPENTESIEICAGREGDDAYVKIDRTNPQFSDFFELFTTARFASET